MTRPQPTWRSLLFVPVTSERFVSKAHTRGADAIILDLEDSILPAHKAAARAALPAAVPRVAEGGADVVVRINRPIDLAVADIAHVRHARRRRPHAAESHGSRACPPARGTRDGARSSTRDADRPHALPRPDRVTGGAAASLRDRGRTADGRNVGWRRGHGDRTRRHSLGRQHVRLCHARPGGARAAGILPMGSMGQLAKIDDLNSYRAGLRRGRALGFTTAACIHPAHVPIINEEYGASAAELDRARRLIAAFDAAAADGAGAVAFEGSMIDLPVVIRAQRLLERARSWAPSGGGN